MKKLNFREDKPKFIDVNPISQMAGGLKEGIVECGGTEKVGIFAPLIFIVNTWAGPLPLCRDSLSSESTNINFHELNTLRPSACSLASKPRTPSLRITFSNATEGTNAIHRAILSSNSHRLHPCRYRRRSSRSGHRWSPTCSTLSSSSHSRYVCSPFRTYSSSRSLRI